MTPAQLARKRANDREAQRAIRARTKEHIERLERELEQYKKLYSTDDRIQELAKRIDALESENKTLREQATQNGLPVPTTPAGSTSFHHGKDDTRRASRPPADATTLSRSQPADRRAVYEQGLQSMHNAAINGRSNPYGHTVRASSDPYANGYTHITTPQGMPTPEATEPWSAPMSVTMPSTVSSPASCGPAEDYRYMPTPVSAPLIDPSSLPPTSVPFQNQDVEYDSVDSGGKKRHDHR